MIWQMANQGPKIGECGHFRRLGDRRGRPVLRRAPLHRRGQPPLRRAEQPPLRPPLSGRRRVHHRRHDLLSRGRSNWEAQGQDIDEFKYFKRWFEEIGAPARRAARPGRRRRPLQGYQPCRRRSRRGSARCSTTSAPCRRRIENAASWRPCLAADLNSTGFGDDRSTAFDGHVCATRWLAGSVGSYAGSDTEEQLELAGKLARRWRCRAFAAAPFRPRPS